MVKGRGMLKGRGNEKGKGDGEKGRGMEKRRGMVKGRAYLGPHRCLLMVLDPRRCLRVCPGRVIIGLCHLVVVACVIVMLSLGRVTSLLLSCVWSCCHCALCSSSCCCAVSSSLPSRVVVVPCHWSIVTQGLSKVSWEEQGMGVTHHGLLTTTTNDVVIHRLVAMLLSVTWHLDLVSEKWMGGGELSHLGSSWPVSVHRCWPS